MYGTRTTNFGEQLTKEHWTFSPYTVWLNPSDNPRCLVIAEEIPYEPAIYNRLKIMAQQNYEYKLLLDDLPSATVYKREVNTTNSDTRPLLEYDYGIPVANQIIKATGPHKGEISVMNHLVLTVDTHTTDSGAIRIVGFEVEAKSINWGDDPCGRKSVADLGP